MAGPRLGCPAHWSERRCPGRRRTARPPGHAGCRARRSSPRRRSPRRGNPVAALLSCGTMSPDQRITAADGRIHRGRRAIPETGIRIANAATDCLGGAIEPRVPTSPSSTIQASAAPVSRPFRYRRGVGQPESLFPGSIGTVVNTLSQLSRPMPCRLGATTDSPCGAARRCTFSFHDRFCGVLIFVRPVEQQLCRRADGEVAACIDGLVEAPACAIGVAAQHCGEPVGSLGSSACRQVGQLPGQLSASCASRARAAASCTSPWRLASTLA